MNLEISKQIFLGTQDPELTMDPLQIINRWDYKGEEYEVITEDGYILPLYRIPHGTNEQNTTGPRPVVFLQHGLENSAADWMINLPNQSAPFLFADAGYDVWIGNFRGNTYAQRHISLTPKDHAFWAFSWSEMAKYDLPAMLKKALEVSKAEKIYYVAHSMGTMAGFAQFSQDQALAQKIKQFYAIGPIMNMKNVKGPVAMAAPYTKYAGIITRIFGVDQFLPNNKLQQMWAKYVCPNPLTDLMCKNVLLMISGPNTHQINESRVPVIDSHSPAGTSVQNILHFGQLMNTGNFQAYDYGSAKANQKHYGTDKPPVYDVSKMDVPVAFYSSEQDWLADPLDVLGAVNSCKKVIANVVVPNFNHMDLVWGTRAAPEIFQPILQSIAKDFKQ